MERPGAHAAAAASFNVRKVRKPLWLVAVAACGLLTAGGSAFGQTDGNASPSSSSAMSSSDGQAMPDRGLQWDATLEWLSDERYRGMSLSERRPVWRAALNVDHDSGLYAGAMLSADSGARTHIARAVTYGGLARPFSGEPQLFWDVGFMTHHFLREDQYEMNYVEPYVGLHGPDWQGRFGYAPHYYGFNVAAAYASGEKAWRVADAWSVSAHAGLLHLQGESVRASQRLRADGRVSLHASYAGFKVSLGVEAAVLGRRGETAAIASASRRF